MTRLPDTAEAGDPSTGPLYVFDVGREPDCKRRGYLRHVESTMLVGRLTLAVNYPDRRFR